MPGGYQPPPIVEIPGSAPLVIVGANGSGKSRFAAQMAGTQGYVYIPADRETTLPDLTGQMLTPIGDSFRDQAGPGQRPRKTSDITQLFLLLKGEEEADAVNFLRATETNHAAERPQSKLSRIERLWQIVFPDRRFSLATRAAKVKWSHADRTSGEYPASEMSDGEKSVLYLTARMVYAPAGVVVVDEPEVHLHSLLARRFWDAVEAERTDCRFVYVTHDLAFALSRKDARIAISRSADSVTLLPKDAGIPATLFQEILGAASLSVLATRIVFCEGVDDGSLDRPFYESWFRRPETAVVPVGSCEAVRQSVEVFSTSSVISSAAAFGVVERDFWSAAWLADLETKGFFVLRVHELEGLLCLRLVADAVADHLGLPGYPSQWAAMEADARRALCEPIIVERAKRRVDVALKGLANAARPDKDRAIARSKFTGVIDLVRKVPDAGALFDEEAAVVDAAVAGSWDDFLRIFPCKAIMGLVAHSLGLTKDTYQSLVISTLADPTGHPELAIAIEGALQGHLPPRT